MTNKSQKINSGPVPYEAKSFRSGFTIIETMISVSLFIIITTVGMGSLLNAHLVYQKSQDMRGIIDNLNFVMEDMSRNIRTGYNYHCFSNTSNEPIPPSDSSILSTPQSCPSGGWAMAFEYAYGDNADVAVDGDAIDYDDQGVYYISDGKIFKSTLGPYALSSFTQMTPDEVDVDGDLSAFIVEGAEPPDGDLQQPFATIRLVGTITYHGVISPFSIQTTVSQRLLDI
jgi:type II secretory pathway pseudopilin PulG